MKVKSFKPSKHRLKQKQITWFVQCFWTAHYHHVFIFFLDKNIRVLLILYFIIITIFLKSIYIFIRHLDVFVTCKFRHKWIVFRCLLFFSSILCFRHADLNQLASSVQEMKNKLSYLKKTASDVNKIRTVGMWIPHLMPLHTRLNNYIFVFYNVKQSKCVITIHVGIV